MTDDARETLANVLQTAYTNRLVQANDLRKVYRQPCGGVSSTHDGVSLRQRTSVHFA
jgi:hypothetical protein